MKFKHHKYTYSRSYGSTIHLWELVGPLGGVQFRAFLTPRYGDNCSLEFHHNSRSGYERTTTEAPDHIKCALTGEPCWREGKSMYAEVMWSSSIKNDLEKGDHDSIFTRLEIEYARRFEESN